GYRRSAELGLSRGSRIAGNGDTSHYQQISYDSPHGRIPHNAAPVAVRLLRCKTLKGIRLAPQTAWNFPNDNKSYGPDREPNCGSLRTLLFSRSPRASGGNRRREM